MLKVVLRSIGRQGLLNDAEYMWIKSHLNMPLRVMSMNFDAKSDSLWHLIVRTDSACGAVIALSIDANKITYEFVGCLQMHN